MSEQKYNNTLPMFDVLPPRSPILTGEDGRQYISGREIIAGEKIASRSAQHGSVGLLLHENFNKN